MGKRLLYGADGNGKEGGVMAETMTDVQKAIEQLGWNCQLFTTSLNEDQRSFSFASMHTVDTDNQTDFGPDQGHNYDEETGTATSNNFGFRKKDLRVLSPRNDDQSWHKGAQRKLAEKARRPVGEAEQLKSMLVSGMPLHIVAPLIDVELSDESDDDGGDDVGSFEHRHLENEEDHGI
jgi:hypothetical protein